MCISDRSGTVSRGKHRAAFCQVFHMRSYRSGAGIDRVRSLMIGHKNNNIWFQACSSPLLSCRSFWSCSSICRTSSFPFCSSSSGESAVEGPWAEGRVGESAEVSGSVEGGARNPFSACHSPEEGSSSIEEAYVLGSGFFLNFLLSIR